MNSTLSSQRLEGIQAPAAKVLLYDSTAGRRNAADAVTSLPRPGRHLRGNNYGFVDGHVKWFSDRSRPQAP